MLEAALQLAAKEPAGRPGLCKLLLDSTIFIIADSRDGSEGTKTLDAGDTVSIRNWARKDGTPIIPFFTSLAILEHSIEQKARYMALPARSLFEMTRGASLVLNPKSPYVKEFLPAEIDAMLETGMNRKPQR